MAPPPMMAPPQAQAQSFARAIFTDITPHPVTRTGQRKHLAARSPDFTVQTNTAHASQLTHFLGCGADFVTVMHQLFRLMFHLGAVLHQLCDEPCALVRVKGRGYRPASDDPGELAACRESGDQRREQWPLWRIIWSPTKTMRWYL
jgi:hypothetical protein